MCLLYRKEIVEMVKDIRYQLRASSDFSVMVSKGLGNILRAAQGWGFNMDISTIEAKYRNAQESDEKRRSAQSSRDEEENTETPELRALEMRSTEVQTNTSATTLTLSGDTLIAIQQDIMYQIASDAEMDCPDVWHAQLEHRLTARQLRWFLLDEDWPINQVERVEGTGPDLYFVDTRPYRLVSSRLVGIGRHSYFHFFVLLSSF
jgi:hypothetical protein